MIAANEALAFNPFLNLVGNKQTAYKMAMSRVPNYLNDNRTLLLQFLRSTEFNAIQAAYKLCDWLEWKRNVFGNNNLPCRHSETSTIASGTNDSTDEGRIHILPTRDTKGRLIVVDDYDWFQQATRSTTSTENANTGSSRMDISTQLRMYWFHFMTICDKCNTTDYETRTNGIVYIMNCMEPSIRETTDPNNHLGGSTAKHDDAYSRSKNSPFRNMLNSVTFNHNILSLLWKTFRLLQCLPIHIHAVHFLDCRSSSAADVLTVEWVVPFVFKLASSGQYAKLKTRFIVHQGISQTEALYSLYANYGIHTREFAPHSIDVYDGSSRCGSTREHEDMALHDVDTPATASRDTGYVHNSFGETNTRSSLTTTITSTNSDDAYDGIDNEEDDGAASDDDMHIDHEELLLLLGSDDYDDLVIVPPPPISPPSIHDTYLSNNNGSDICIPCDPHIRLSTIDELQQEDDRLLPDVVSNKSLDSYDSMVTTSTSSSIVGTNSNTTTSDEEVDDEEEDPSSLQVLLSNDDYDDLMLQQQNHQKQLLYQRQTSY